LKHLKRPVQKRANLPREQTGVVRNERSRLGKKKKKGTSHKHEKKKVSSKTEDRGDVPQVSKTTLQGRDGGSAEGETLNLKTGGYSG